LKMSGVLLLFATCLLFSAGLGDELVGSVSDSLNIPCPHNSADCGEIHSIKWYRGVERVFVYSPFSNFRNAENIFKGRADVVETGDNSELVVDGLLATDDGNYRCEITYLDVSSACQSVFQHTLTTTALPMSVSLSVGEEQLLQLQRDSLGQTSGVAGPYQLETELELVCRALEVKPSASLAWTVAGQAVEATQSDTEDLGGGAVNVVSRLQLPLERQHLAAEVACSVNFQDSEIAHLSVELDITVGPEEVALQVDQLVAGEPGQATCTVLRAKPAAHPSWRGLDGTEFTEDVQELMEDDNTVTVSSTIMFTPSSSDHSSPLSCIVEMEHPIELNIEQTEILDVEFAPEVMVDEENMTRHEGERLELRCPYTANPANLTTVTWLFNSEEIVPTEDMHFGLTDAEDAEDTEEEQEEEDGVVDVLVLERLDRSMAGDFSCRVENSRGATDSAPVNLHVMYVPEVELSLEAADPLVEGSGANATLRCTLLDGSPHVMDSVTWLLDGGLVVEEECGDSECELELDGNRGDSGNWSCQASNQAGAGAPSNPQHLQVQYTASEGSVENFDVEPVKGGNCTLICHLEDLGFPPVDSYTWTRNDEPIDGETDELLVLEELEATSVANYSCSGVNAAGTNFGPGLFLDVFAPLAFIEELEPEAVMEEDYQWVNLTCQAECSPPCSIQWLRGINIIEGGESYKTLMKAEEDTSLFSDYEVMISTAVDPDETTEDEDKLELLVSEEMISQRGEEGEEVFFSVFSEVQPIDPQSNQFESVMSTLAIQLGNRTAQLINSFQHANFTCVARQRQQLPDRAAVRLAETEAVLEDEPVGYAAEAADAEGVEEISSTSMLVIQHMPMEIELAPPPGVDLYDDALTVAEGDTIEPLTCAALAVPQAEVVWLKDGETVSGDASLRFSEPIQRSDGGEYTCQATNQHGTAQQAVLLNVQHAPQCSVSFEEQEELLELKCEAVGYPQDFVFWWRHNSQSFEGQMIDGFSLLSLKKESVNVSVLNEYVCMVNNTMGQSEPCSLPSHGLLVDNPLLLFAVVGGAVLALLLLLFLAWCLCCRDNADTE